MSGLTRPERWAQMREAKRYRKAIEKRGICSACIHRETTFGLAHCHGKEERSFGACERDGKAPRFEFDPASLEQFKDAA